MALQASLRHMYVADVLQEQGQAQERLVWRELVNKKPPSGGRDGSPLRSKSAILVALLPMGEVSRSDGGGWTYLHEKGVHNCEPLSRGDGRTTFCLKSEIV